MTAIVTTARSIVLEGSRLCTEEMIALLLSLATLLQEKLGCSQGTMADEAFVSEQPPTVEAITVLGATMLKHKAPNR